MTFSLARKARAAVDVGRAAVAVSRARQTVARRPIGALVERTGLSADSPEFRLQVPAALPQVECRRGERWGAAVDRALRWLPGDSACLVRATALCHLLSADGATGAIVRIGVRRGAAGFEAHAWVEQDGTPIAEPVALQGAFSSLEGVTLRDGGRLEGGVL